MELGASSAWVQQAWELHSFLTPKVHDELVVKCYCLFLSVYDFYTIVTERQCSVLAKELD